MLYSSFSALLLTVTPLIGGETIDRSVVYPIDPMPLRLLCEVAPLIAVVKAGEPRLRKVDDPNDWEVGEVDLEILRILKGEIAVPSVTVRYSPGMICPAPASFNPGKTHLVFLKDTGEEFFRTVALSYGSKDLQGDALTAYTDAVKKWMQIQELEKLAERQTAMVEWLVGLAENPHTRWEGAFEFHSARYLPTHFTEDRWIYKWPMLTSEQKQRLVIAQCASKTFDFGDQTLLEILKDDKDPRLDAYLLSLLNQWEFDVPFRAGKWIHLAAMRSENERALEFFLENWKPFSFGESKSGRLTNWRVPGADWKELLALQNLLLILEG
jgi:hypothetical protein